MKKKELVLSALLGIASGISLHAEGGVELTPTEESWVFDHECYGCETLSEPEEIFAGMLTERNRKAFCSKFSAEQRKAAMVASCNTPINCGTMRNAGKLPLKPNDAVSQIMRENNMSMEEKRESIASPDLR